MVQILIVCTANICRSPVVAALLKQRLQEHGYNDWQVDSAGTWAINPRRAAQNSIRLMADQGLDISKHRAKIIDEQLIARADLVLCMELGHVEALQVEFNPYRKKIYALSEMVGEKYSVEDPYGGSLNDYREMVAKVTELLDKGFERIVAIAEKNFQMRNA